MLYLENQNAFSARLLSAAHAAGRVKYLQCMGEGHKPHDYVGRATDWHTTLRAVAVKYRCTVALAAQFRKKEKSDSQMVILY